MSVAEGMRLVCPVGQRPKAQRSDRIGIFGAFTSSRTVKVECAVAVSAAS